MFLNEKIKTWTGRSAQVRSLDNVPVLIVDVLLIILGRELARTGVKALVKAWSSEMALSNNGHNADF